MADARERIEKFRRDAILAFENTKKERARMIDEVSRTLNITVSEVQMRHELVRKRLRDEAVRREVHVRVNRSLGALADFLNVQREDSINEQQLIAAIADPAITGSTADKVKKASVSELILSAQKQLIQQSEFINVAAHELRTPIMPILAYAEILESSMTERSVEVEAIKRNAVRLQRLAENILNVARIDSNTLALRRQLYDLNTLVEEIVRDKGSSKGARVVFEASGPHVRVSVDRERISQVLSNLLDNAIKFAKEGRIVVSTRKLADEVLIQVMDDGPGIDPEAFPVLFTKFGARSQGGTGLGLFICKGIIEAHGGKISARNRLDGGAASSSPSRSSLEAAPRSSP